MDVIQERAYAKLNLTLGVLYKRHDGYHALDTLMQSVDLFDTLTIERDTQVSVTATGQTLPYNNTLRRAALAYQAYTGKGARIHVVKRIPAESGMGGGSADAAAVLNGMQKLYDSLDEGTIADIALLVGADVPFCLRGGLQRAEGIGELLTPLAGCDMHFVIAKPALGVSTKQLFYSLKLPRPQPDTARAIAAIAGGDLRALGKLLFNALEEAATAFVPAIGELHDALLQHGAFGASMTGSGSTVFGLFETEEQASAAAGAIQDLAPFVRVCRAIW